MANYFVDSKGKVTKNKNKKKEPTYFVSLDGKVTKNKDYKYESPYDIAPVLEDTTEEDSKWYQGWLKKGDGTFGQNLKATGIDIGEDLAIGVVGSGEKLLDTLMAIAPTVNAVNKVNSGKMLSDEDWEEHDKQRKESEEFIKKDLYDEEEVVKKRTEKIEKKSGIDVESMSFFDKKADSLVQSAGQMGVTLTTSLANPLLGTAILGGTAFGSEMENALNEGASYDEALISSTVTAGAEILSEKISGAIKVGGKTLDELIPMDKLTKNISSKVARGVINTVSGASGEGFEEIFSGVISAIGQKMTYMEEKEIKELFSSEEALDSFIGGAILGGVSSGVKTAVDTAKGKDSITGMSDKEKTVFDKVYKDTVAENETGDNKLSNKEKNKIYDETLKKFEKGYIDIDTIESALGGKTYEEYNKLSEEAEEFNRLYTTESGKLSEQQKDRLAELKEKNATKSYEESLKELKGRLTQEVRDGVKGNKLLEESYNEKARRSQKYEVDLTTYDENQQAVIKNAMDSGVLNNTNKTHDFVDFIAKLTAGKEVNFDFANNEKLKSSGFSIEGKTINGYVQGNNIVLNVDSAKALNTVVGHEITHVLEGTELYSELQTLVEEYAKTKGEYDSRMEDIVHKYRKQFEGEANEERLTSYKAELTADLVGDYLFTDADFVNNLSATKPNIFKKVFDEIKYLCKLATTGSTEEKKLLEIKRTFEKAFKENTNANRESENKFHVDFTPKTEAGITYESLIAKPDMAVSEITTDINTIDMNNRDGIAKESMEKLISKGLRGEDGAVRIHNKDNDKDIIVGKPAIAHGLDRNYEYTALVSMHLDSYLENAIKINEALPDVNRKHESDIYLGYGETTNGDKIPAYFIVSKLTTGKEELVEFGSLYSLRAKKIAEDSTKGSPDFQFRTSANISISDLLDLVNVEYSDVLPQTVADHYGNERRDTKIGKSVKYSFAGKNSLTAEESQLIKARDMEIEGADSEDIRKTTGWHRGYEGKWKYEIDDSAMEIIDIESDTLKLAELIKHDELFKAYPSLKNINVSFKNFDDGTNGGINGESFNLELNTELKTDTEKLKSTLIHEIQHLIQFEERFANGSSPEYWDDVLKGEFDSRPQRIIAEEKELQEQYMSMLETEPDFVAEMLNLESMTPTSERGAMDWETFEQIEEDPIEWQEFDAERDRLSKKYGITKVFDFMDMRHNMKELKTKGVRTGRDLYYDTAGEIEAREVSRRRKYSKEEREKYVPQSKYENLKRDNVVFARYSMGEQNVAPTGNYNVYGKDIAFDETAESDIAPVTEETTGEENKVAGEDLSKKNADAIRTIKAEIQGHRVTRDITKKEFDEKIAKKESEYEALSRKDTKKAVDLRNQITNLETRRDSLIKSLDDKIERANNRIESIERESRFEKRRAKQQQYRELFSNLIGDTSTWKDKKYGLQYQTNTFRRNLRDIVRDANGKQDIERADAIYDELQGSVNKNEAKKNREANAIKDTFREMKINNAESTYIQMLGELRHNPDTTLTQEIVDEYYNANKGKIDTQKVDKAIDEARKLYDDLYDRVNKALSEHGFKEMGYRKGYFPHFTDPKQNWLAKLLNWKVNKDDIPTDIAGLTEFFEPQRTWQSFDKHRMTDTTDYNFLKGLDNYVNGSLDWIYHIGDIQKHRAFETEIRYRHSSEAVQKKIDEYRNNPMLSEEEVESLIKSALKEAKNPLHNFVTDLHTRTNILAGKKSSKDRNMESDFNRHAYSVMTNITSRVSANQVAGSVSSALTNFIPITQSWGQVSPISSLGAMQETIQNVMKDDGTIEKSDFLTNRLATNEALYKDGWDKASEVVGGLMEIFDNFTSQTVWRSKYNENIKNGMNEDEAIKDADQFAENVIGGRSKGNMPTIFHAKNPVSRVFTSFQLEVSNQYGYMFKDMPQGIKEKALFNLAKGYTTMFVGAYVYNALYSTLAGRDSAFDPIRILQEFIGDLNDDDEEKKVANAIEDLAGNVADEIPYIGGLLGGGRIPISSALPYDGSIKNAYKDITEGDWKSVMDELSNTLYYGVLPMGGGQIRKTVQGLSMFDDDLLVSGSYTKSGKLRFPVEETFLNKLQAGVFGQYSSQNAKEYFDRELAPLGEKQIQEYKDLELPISEYWNYRKGLTKQDTVEDKFEYVASMDVSNEQKNIMINNAVDRKEKIDMSNYDEFANYEEFDFYSKNTDKYEFLEDNGISYYQYKLNEDTKDYYDSIYDWYKDSPDEVRFSKIITDDVFEYKKYMKDLNNFHDDEQGTTKEKRRAYISGLDLDKGQKMILERMFYKTIKEEYDPKIIKYLRNQNISDKDISFILDGLKK